MWRAQEVLLGVSILVTFAKYVLHLVNAQLAMNWANKVRVGGVCSAWLFTRLTFNLVYVTVCWWQ